MSKLALLGGPKTIEDNYDFGDMFKWPIVTKEDEDAVLDVLRNGAMSGTDITKKFESEFAEWNGTKYALAYPNGTESLRGAMWACGVGAGDDVICPSMTYWASCTSALSLGAAVNFADIDPDSLCIAPKDIEHRIGPKTKAIIVVHYAGYPCDMDEIMAIAKKHDVKVIEDVSHAQGGLYKGKRLGAIGDISGMSLMSGKSLAIGEGGMMLTDDPLLYERCIAYGHYERTGAKSNFNAVDAQVTVDELKKFAGCPLGGFKHRMNQTVSAMGRVQLKYYDQRCQEIRKAMKYFWKQLDGVPGLKEHHPNDKNSNMAGLYAARGLYKANELYGIPCHIFAKAVSAEGYGCHAGANAPLHIHEVFHSADIFNMGKPTMISFGQEDFRQGKGTLPISENIANICYSVPWFKHYRPDVIETVAKAYRKVAENAKDLVDYKEEEK